MEAHLKEARKQESELKETVARLTGELKKVSVLWLMVCVSVAMCEFTVACLASEEV